MLQEQKASSGAAFFLHSSLNFYGGFAETTYSVVGKHTEIPYPYKKMEVLHGGIIVTNKRYGYGEQSGARMGVESSA